MAAGFEYCCCSPGFEFVTSTPSCSWSLFSSHKQTACLEADCGVFGASQCGCLLFDWQRSHLLKTNLRKQGKRVKLQTAGQWTHLTAEHTCEQTGCSLLLYLQQLSWQRYGSPDGVCTFSCVSAGVWCFRGRSHRERERLITVKWKWK